MKTMQQISNGDYSIPRKSLNSIGQSQKYLNDISISSEIYRNVYQRVILSHLSNGCQDRELIRIARCRIVCNKSLETRFLNYQRSLESQCVPADVTFAYSLLSDNMREMELIAQFGVPVNNNFVGDLGEPANGVYLSEHPDLVTPAPFVGRTKLRILACQVLKGRCNTVGLGSYRLMPTQGCHSHIAMQPVDSKLTRHDNYRYDQIFLFEEKGNGYSKSPANVLPYAVYDMEFPPNTTLSFKAVESIVWSGTLLIGIKRYSRVSLCSLASATKPPLLDVLEITDLIHWTACLAFPPILELLKPPALGEIALKKEVLLTDSRRLVYYFTLFSVEGAHDFISLHESMRIRRVAGITIFPSVGIFILLPNGLFSDLLALPKTAGSVFHCLYLTVDASCSLISGAFEAMTTEENDEFTRPLLLQERVDGLDSRVQELVRNVAQKTSGFKNVFDNQLKTQKDEPLGVSSEPVDMDIADDSDDDDKRGWREGRMDTTSAQVPASVLNLKPNSPRSVNEAVSEAARLLSSSDPRREKAIASRDPRKRPGLISSQNLPIPSCAAGKGSVQNWSSSRECLDTEKKPVSSSFDALPTGSRSYSPSDAISVSSGGSSPKTGSHFQKSPRSPNPSGSDNAPVVNFIKNESESNETESPASPPHEPGVFVAAAPKIISDYDMRSTTESPFQSSTRQYRAPEVTPFTALTSMKSDKSGPSESQQHDSMVDDGDGDLTTSPPSDNDIPVIDEKPTYILPELVSFPRIQTQRTTGTTSKNSPSPPLRSRHSRWDVFPSTASNDRHLSGEREIETVSTGDVDMRSMIPGNSSAKISHEALSATTLAMQAPIVFSNGDTDHRIRTTAAIRPSTSSSQPPSSFTSHPGIRPLLSFTPTPSAVTPRINTAATTSRMAESKEPLVYGFFNQPIVHHPQKPYLPQSVNFPVHLSRRGVLMIDDTQFTRGLLDLGIFRMILERFSNWRRNSSILWWVKLHVHLRQSLSVQVNSSDSDPKLSEKYVHYEEIIAEYENSRVVQTMEAHECDKQTNDLNSLLKCLTHIANANRKCAMIYLSDVAKDSAMGKQIASTGFEICCSTNLLKKFSL